MVRGLISGLNWKCQARDKGKEVVISSDSFPIPGTKRGLQTINVTIPQEFTSPSKKKNKLVEVDVTAVVAKQPHRSL